MQTRPRLIMIWLVVGVIFSAGAMIGWVYRPVYKGRSVASWRAEIMKPSAASDFVSPDLEFKKNPDPRAIPVFRELIHDEDHFVRYVIVYCVRLLGRAGAPMTKDVIRLCSDPYDLVACTAIDTLETVEPDSDVVMATVSPFFRDASESKRLVALGVAVDRHRAEQSVIDNLVDILSTTDYVGPKCDAMRLLARCDIRNSAVRQNLLAAVKGKGSDQYQGLQATAIEELGKCNAADAPELAEAIRQLQQNESVYIRFHATCSYFQLTGDVETAMASLSRIDPNDKENQVCGRCGDRLVEILVAIARKDPNAIDRLSSFAQKIGYREYREEALIELQKLKSR
jgi:hypothetical protein